MPRPAPTPEIDPSGPIRTTPAPHVTQSEEASCVFALITPNTLYLHREERWSPRPYFILSGTRGQYPEFSMMRAMELELSMNQIEAMAAMDTASIQGSRYQPLEKHVFTSEVRARTELQVLFEEETRGTISGGLIEVHTAEEEQVYLATRILRRKARSPHTGLPDDWDDPFAH